MTRRHLAYWQRSLACLALCITPLALGNPTTTPSTQSLLRPPDAQTQLRLEKLIKDLFKSEYARTSAGEKLALAGKLLDQGMQATDDAAARFVLLCESRDLAAAAGQCELSLRAVDELGRHYAIDALAMKTRCLSIAWRNVAGDGKSAHAAAMCAVDVFDQAILGADVQSAQSILGVAQASAAKAQSVAVASKVHGCKLKLVALVQESERYAQACQRLSREPQDAAAAFAVGRFLCLYKGDWASGLPMLGKGVDGPLGGIAREDLGDPSEAGSQLRLANAWWDFSQTQPYPAARHVQDRARRWYAKALPSLAGFNRTLAESRLNILTATTQGDMMARPGLIAELFRDEKFQDKLTTRIDSQIDFDWGSGVADEGMPKDDFSIRWTGLLKAPKAGRYILVVIANSGVRLWIDEKLVFENAVVYRKRAGMQVPIDLTEAMHEFRLEFWDTGGVAKMKLQWAVPGAKDPMPIPPEAFWHDPSKLPQVP